MTNQSNKRNRWTSLISSALIVALMMTTFVGVGTAYADEGEEPEREKAGERIDERLEACFDKLNEWYEVQGGNIGKAHNAISRIEGGLAKAEELGIDTSAIQALMPSLYAAVDQAEAYHARAGEILSEHAGFNGSSLQSISQ